MIDSSVEIFFEHLRVERGLSSHTIRAYEVDLEHFCDYLQNGVKAFNLEAEEDRKQRVVVDLDTLGRARRQDVRSFLMHLQGAGCSTRTVCRKLSALKTVLSLFC